MQHLQHHKRLGLAGSIVVVTPHAAESLMQSRGIRRAVQRRELVLLQWDDGLEPRASHFMQIPANNLLRLAAWGSSIRLGFWDLDEYLVLPRHNSIQQEMHTGCLKGVLSAMPEAIIPSTWVSAPSWDAGAELHGWMAYGHWAAAVQAMGYVGWNYAFCSGVCKVLVDPNTDMLFQVHGHARTPRDVGPSKEVPRSCAYLLHFYQLWQLRQPELMKRVAGSPGTPLQIGEVLPAMVQRMAELPAAPAATPDSSRAAGL
ncbi:hypothetical protein OEZ85_003283 [Tetradesmus obliquus]|uniref:Glycosyltransferase family 92 protein n=1 Tax=Tetradesmus obliquus TaxID=3088 RepID=A0ABY8U0D0_TETOB|nr:hypothetical protein OEZ85_003283 [Tetradesmus obliquus]